MYLIIIMYSFYLQEYINSKYAALTCIYLLFINSPDISIFDTLPVSLSTRIECTFKNGHRLFYLLRSTLQLAPRPGKII